MFAATSTRAVSRLQAASATRIERCAAQAVCGLCPAEALRMLCSSGNCQVIKSEPMATAPKASRAKPKPAAYELCPAV